MNKIFADAFFWIALANPSDQWHSAAKRFNQTNPGIPLVTTDEVLTEFLNYFSGVRGKHKKIVSGMCDGILAHPNITVFSQTHDSFLKGLDLYRQRPDKGYSLTDCSSMALMLELGLTEVLTHDKHFAQEGFRVLL
jgi:predicted nucleic acid-binding protein